jgi:CheY-like chemotaxis protein
LRERALAATRDIRAAARRERLLEEVAGVHEDFLREMMGLSRHVTDLEDKLLGRDGDISTTSVPRVFQVLVVDDEPALPALLRRDLSRDRGWSVRAVQSGGEALDAAVQSPTHILVVKETLPDLPASMVVKSVKSVRPEMLVLVFRPPGADGGGVVKMVETSRVTTLIPSFSEPQQLVFALEDVREGLRKKATERRYLSVFRKQHFEFLKRYNTLKQKLAAK